MVRSIAECGTLFGVVVVDELVIGGAIFCGISFIVVDVGNCDSGVSGIKVGVGIWDAGVPSIVAGILDVVCGGWSFCGADSFCSSSSDVSFGFQLQLPCPSHITRTHSLMLEQQYTRALV